MKCPKCLKENDSIASFCEYCGTKMHPEQAADRNRCPKCLKENDSIANFCEHCGANMHVDQDENIEEKNDSAVKENPENHYSAEEESADSRDQMVHEDTEFVFEEEQRMESTEEETVLWNHDSFSPWSSNLPSQEKSHSVRKNPYDALLDEYYGRMPKEPQKAEKQKISPSTQFPVENEKDFEVSVAPKKGNKSWIMLILLLFLLIGIAGGLGIGFIIGKMGDVSDSAVSSESEITPVPEIVVIEMGGEPFESVVPLTPAAEAVSLPTPTPTPTLAPEYLTTVMKYEAASIDESKRVSVVNAKASSVIKQEDLVNEPYLLFDYNEQTNWQEGVSGSGIGEYIKANLGKTEKIRYISFRLGNWKTDRYFTGNNYPTQLRLQFGGITKTVKFPGHVREEFVVEIIPPCETSYLNIVIDEVSRGTEWDDTVITDVSLFRE